MAKNLGDMKRRTENTNTKKDNRKTEIDIRTFPVMYGSELLKQLKGKSQV